MGLLLTMVFLGMCLAVTTCFLVISYDLGTKNKATPLRNWPIVGMLPEFVFNLHRIYDRMTEILEACGGTLLYKGPSFTGTDLLFTVDPANVQYILSQNFSNFDKGPKFHRIFDSMGDGIFNSDKEMWKKQKKISLVWIYERALLQQSQEKTREKLRNGLIPILDRLSLEKKHFDVQDFFQRLTLDLTCTLVTGFDPDSLSNDVSEVPYVKAGRDINEAAVYRHVLPEGLWRLLRWLDVGPEKKHRRGCDTIDGIIFRYISMIKIKRQQQRAHHDADLVSTCMNIEQDIHRLGLKCDDGFLRDMVMNYIFAGREAASVTPSWLFWLLSKHPRVVTKIREEVEQALATMGTDDTTSFTLGDLNKLVYLHGALCETLRLYPPVPFQHKSPIGPDVLPTGHRVDPKSTILFSLYSMGRMRSIWGDDCLEFKPERWIEGDDMKKIRQHVSYKFPAFNSGPRICPGKDVAMAQLKLVVTTIIHNYDVKVVEERPVVPQLSVILNIKHGLMIRVTKRRHAPAK